MSSFAIYSIPLYWMLALYPHTYAIKLIQTANPKTWNNANPRGQDTNSAYKKSVPADVFAAYERAEAAHKNLLENAPLFVGAVLAGCYAGVDSGTLNSGIAAYLALRVVYVFLYIRITKLKYSFLRTANWALSTGVLFWLYVAAGRKVGAKV